MQPRYISLDGLVVGILMPWWGVGVLSQKTQILPSSIQLNGCDIPRSTSVRNLGVSLDQALFPTTRIPYMSGLLSRTPSNQFRRALSHPRCYQNSSALLFCLVLITVIHFLLGAPKIWYVNFKKFKIRLPALVVLSGVTTYYLRSFMLYTGFLSNPAFSTKFFF